MGSVLLQTLTSQHQRTRDSNVDSDCLNGGFYPRAYSLQILEISRGPLRSPRGGVVEVEKYGVAFLLFSVWQRVWIIQTIRVIESLVVPEEGDASEISIVQPAWGTESLKSMRALSLTSSAIRRRLVEGARLVWLGFGPAEETVNIKVLGKGRTFPSLSLDSPWKSAFQRCMRPIQ